MKETRESVVPPTQNSQNPDVTDVIGIDDDGGCEDLPSPITIREQRIINTRKNPDIKKRHDRADQAGQDAAEDHRTTDVTNVLHFLQSQDENVLRKTLQKFHIK